jgi:ParB family chromosome partitioning protein
LYGKSNKKKKPRPRICPIEDPENDIKSVDDKNADKVVGNIIELEIEAIEINPFQPRSNFNEESLRRELVSIKELGVIQPTVRKLDFNKYLNFGERRLRASTLVGLTTVPLTSASRMTMNH